jgi:hypothetical protein
LTLLTVLSIKDMAVLGAVRGYEAWLKRSEDEVVTGADEGADKPEVEEGFGDEDLKELEEADPLILMDDLDVGHIAEETAGLSKLFLFCCTTRRPRGSDFCSGSLSLQD